VLARRSAAKVIASQQDFCTGITRVVEDKIRVWAAIWQIAPAAKKSFGQSSFIGHFQKAGRDNLIGVDIVTG
jgi:hypothetical protein